MTLTLSLNTIKNSSKALYDDFNGHACSTSSHVGNDNFFVINSWIFIYALWLKTRVNHFHKTFNQSKKNYSIILTSEIQ